MRKRLKKITNNLLICHFKHINHVIILVCLTVLLFLLSPLCIAQQNVPDNFDKKRKEHPDKEPRVKDKYKRPKSKSIYKNKKDKKHRRPPSKNIHKGRKKDKYQRPKSINIWPGKVTDRYERPESVTIYPLQTKDNYEPPRSVNIYDNQVKDQYKKPRSVTIYDNNVKDRYKKSKSVDIYEGPVIDNYKRPKSIDIYPEKVKDRYQKPKSIDIYAGRVIDHYKRPISIKIYNNSFSFRAIIKKLKRPDDFTTWEGNSKVATNNSGKNRHTHPSYNQKKTKSLNHYKAGQYYKKIVLWWNSLFSNNKQPKHLEEEHRRPRYDPQERKIWNE